MEENKLTKDKIVNTVADKYALEAATVKRVVQATLDTISDALAKGGSVELRDFGIFEVKKRKGRQAYNFAKKTKIFIPERPVVKFKQGKLLGKRVLKGA